jgi:hypothetical protein
MLTTFLLDRSTVMDSVAQGGRCSNTAIPKQKGQIGNRRTGPRSDDVNSPDDLHRYLDRLTDVRIVREARQYRPIVGDRGGV